MVKKSKSTLSKNFYIKNPLLLYPDYNEYSLGGWFKDTTAKLGDWNTEVTEKLMGSNFGKGLSNLGIKSTGLGGIFNTGVNVATGLFNKNNNQTKVGNVMQKVGSLASNIPGVGGLIGAGVNLVGGIVNAGFGSNLNEEFINQTEQAAEQQARYVSNASSNQQLLSDYSNLSLLGSVEKSDVGSEGWWSNKATNKTNELNQQIEEANLKSLLSIGNTAENIDKNNFLMLQATSAAYGGPLNKFDEGGYKNVYEMPFIQRNQYARTGRITNAGYPVTPLGKGYKTMKALGRFRKAFKERPWDPNGAFTTSIKGFIDDTKNVSGSETKKNLLQFSKYLYNQFVGNKGQNLGITQYETENKKEMKDGGSIHIKPSHRGRLTELKARTGKSEAELYNDGNPAHKKMVVFARNARKWHHADGGPLDTRMKLLKRLEERRNRRGNYDGGQYGGAGAGSLFLESPDDFTLVKDTIWVPYRETFNDAFGRARAAGLEKFMFDNKAYTTELGDNPDNNRAGEERAIEGLLPVERTRQVKNKKAEGGNLFTNGVTFINNGDTHENNPLEGVRIGVDENNIPNLVEEGEVIYDDYVFSNRLRVPKAIRQKYKLRGVTFADAAKQLQKESEERPNDPISKNGLDASMSMLQQEQEAIRMKKENNKYAKGGKLGRVYDGTGGDPNWLYKPVTQGFIPSKDDILSEMRNTYLREEELPIAPFVRSGVFSKPEDSITKDSSNSSWLRTVPIIGHAAGVVSDFFSKPDYSTANRIASVDLTPTTVGYTPIGNYLTYTPLDRDYYLNKLNADTAASIRAIINTSGGNRAAAMAGLLAADYNYGNQLGALARQAEEYNLAQRQKVEDFNRATNMANAEMELKTSMANADARNKANQLRLSQAGSVAAMRKAIKDEYDTRRSSNINVLLDEIGGLGTENTYKSWLNQLAKAGVLKVDADGNFIASAKDVKTSNAYGGKIKTKKKKGFTYG